MVQLLRILDLKQAIEQRRAARSFFPDPIPEDILAEILRLGLRAPSGFNLQPWRFVVIRDASDKETLKSCAFDQRQVGEAPVTLICCGDRRVQASSYVDSVIHLGKETGAMTEDYAEGLQAKVDQVFQNQPSFGSLETWTNRHTMLAVAHLMITAKAFGVDTCPMEGFSSSAVKEAFAIPEEVDVCCLLAMGYAAAPYKKYGGRFSTDQVCFNGRYGEPFHLKNPPN
jgi:nitroreductase